MCCYMHVQQVTLIAYLVSVGLLPWYLQPYNSHDHLLSDKKYHDSCGLFWCVKTKTAPLPVETLLS